MIHRNKIHKMTNRYFFRKFIFSTALIMLAALCMTLFFRDMQLQISRSWQQETSEYALNEIVSSMREGIRTNKAISRLYHDGNQDILYDLEELLQYGGLVSLRSSISKGRSEYFQRLADHSNVDYLFLLSDDGRIMVSSAPVYQDQSFLNCSLVSSENAEALMQEPRRPTAVFRLL